MKKNYLFYAILFSIFIYSCDKDNDSITDTSAEKSPDSKDLVLEYSYILGGERYTVEVDYSSGEPQISQTDEFLAISDILESSETVEYYNPEIDGMVLFRNFEEYEMFSQNKKVQQSLKNKFQPENLPVNRENSMAKQGPVSGSTPPFVSIHKAKNFGAGSFTMRQYTRIGHLDKNTDKTNGINFNDDISSIIVTNAFAIFWQHVFNGHTLIIDSYSYRTEVPNLRNLAIRGNSPGTSALILANGLTDNSAACGWLCKSWNDEITTLEVRVDGSKEYNPS